MGKQLNVEQSVISAKDDALFFNAMIAKNGVWQFGQKLDYEIASANQINIKDGMVTAQGRNYVIYPNEVDSLTIENGVANSQRYDLIVYEVSRTDGIETLALKVIKGTQGTEPVDPVLTQDDTLTSGTIYQMPLYRVHLNGINIEAVDDLRTFIASFGERQPNLLINGDFQVNTRGLDTYTEGNYACDKWYCETGHVGLTAKGIVLFSVSQKIKALAEDKYTFAYRINGQKNQKSIVLDSVNDTKSDGYLTVQLITDETHTKIIVSSASGQQTNRLNYVSLTRGVNEVLHIREPYETAVARCHPISYGTELPSTLEDGDIFLLVKE